MDFNFICEFLDELWTKRENYRNLESSANAFSSPLHHSVEWVFKIGQFLRFSFANGEKFLTAINKFLSHCWEDVHTLLSIFCDFRLIEKFAAKNTVQWSILCLLFPNHFHLYATKFSTVRTPPLLIKRAQLLKLIKFHFKSDIFYLFWQNFVSSEFFFQSNPKS